MHEVWRRRAFLLAFGSLSTARLQHWMITEAYQTLLLRFSQQKPGWQVADIQNNAETSEERTKCLGGQWHARPRCKSVVWQSSLEAYFPTKHKEFTDASPRPAFLTLSCERGRNVKRSRRTHKALNERRNRRCHDGCRSTCRHWHGKDSACADCTSGCACALRVITTCAMKINKMRYDGIIENHPLSVKNYVMI